MTMHEESGFFDEMLKHRVDTSSDVTAEAGASATEMSDEPADAMDTGEVPAAGVMHPDARRALVILLRQGVVSALRALYHAEDGSVITLAALFWTTQATNALSYIKRVYIVSTRDLSLKEVLHAFEGGNVRAMKQWLRDDSTIKCFDENFSEYQACYRKLLWMENKNAPDLLSRALGLKKIDDLTQLIRELVLEPSTVRDDARSVVDEQRCSFLRTTPQW